MLCRCALLFALSVTAVASAQEEIQQIKQQMAHLQQLLDAMENQPAPKRNVTQIGASRKRKAETGLVVKIYDLGDLFAVAPPYPAQLSSDLNPDSRSSLFDTTVFPAGGGMMGGMGGGMFSVSPTTAFVNSQKTATALSSVTVGQVSGGTAAIKTSQDELMTVIKETITPDLWKEGGKITRLGNAFVISADEDSHQQIETLLNLFRARWGTLRTVSVRGWWLSLSPADLRGLLDVPTEKVTPDGPPVFGIVSEDAWKDLLKIWEQPAGNDAYRLRYQATLTCYNGQTVSTVSGTQDLAVSGIDVVVSRNENDQSQGKIGYQPETATIQQGLAFQVTPVTNVSGKTVLLDVHSRLTLPANSDESDAGRKRSNEIILPDDVVRPIDRRRLNVHRMSTTARIPVDRPYLVGGMSLPSAETEGLQLYLFVKVSVQELRNDQESAGRPIDEPAESKVVEPKVEKPREPESK